MTGSIFENYIVSEVIKKEIHQKSKAELFYLRTSHGEEIDLIIDRKQYRELIEIKYSETFTPKMTQTIEMLFEPGDMGYLLYQGKKQHYLSEIAVMHYLDYFV